MNQVDTDPNKNGSKIYAETLRKQRERENDHIPIGNLGEQRRGGRSSERHRHGRRRKARDIERSIVVVVVVVEKRELLSPWLFL